MTVIPRPASTIVLLDHSSRVYLTKRPKTMKFFGGFYVFPGGAVEKGDYALDFEYIKNGIRNESFDAAYYVAAARELFEEVGVLLGSTDDGSDLQLNKGTAIEYRRLLLDGEISFLQLLKQEGLHLNLDNITFFGHLVTPKEKPIRFDTRFFITQLPNGQYPNPDVNEVDEANWFSPQDALSAYQSGKISLAPPTIIALRTIMNSQNGTTLMMPDLQTAKKWFE
ncbi:NUDIX hydrolase [Neobacillus drentensis]|uniref:NUDIX hydrolase n=1 Tax=Neobacillus drentensis TaxID=220684 RepID=UPI0030034733